MLAMETTADSRIERKILLIVALKAAMVLSVNQLMRCHSSVSFLFLWIGCWIHRSSRVGKCFEYHLLFILLR